MLLITLSICLSQDNFLSMTKPKQVKLPTNERGCPFIKKHQQNYYLEF